ERMCSQGLNSIKITGDYDWYINRVLTPQEYIPARIDNKHLKGCPFDCGPCAWHTGALNLPVFSITNDCNLDCPKCFTYNRPDKKYYKSVPEVKKILGHIRKKNKDLQLINLTGGEPTLHPKLFDIIKACRNAGIHRITMNTNGLELAKNNNLAGKLKRAGVQVVLSLDTLDPEKSILIHGRDITKIKKKALHKLEKLNIPTTILSVAIKDLNDKEVAENARKYIKKDFVRSITIQNMTYTGKNGSVFKPRKHITIDEVERLIDDGREFSSNDFFSLGAYHPLCYSAAYYIVRQGKVLSLSKAVDKTVLTDLSRNGYVITPEENATRFAEGINRLWAEGTNEGMIKSLKNLLKELYPAGNQLSAAQKLSLTEKLVKMIYIHPHMDEDNFDIDRVSRCGDLVPDESGRMIPACSYNLLYRQKDPRFWEGS
ncbi:MAG: radical SAM protein, partial [bacterium]|nr:radical SAM protein [bacterium]